jgi:hypothetical protein
MQRRPSTRRGNPQISRGTDDGPLTQPEMNDGDRQLQESVQEDWFWGRINTTGAEEDYYWRRLSDNYTNPSGGRQTLVSNVAVGPYGTQTHNLYRTPGSSSQLKLLASIPDNIITTYLDGIADGSLGANIGVTNTTQGIDMFEMQIPPDLYPSDTTTYVIEISYATRHILDASLGNHHPRTPLGCPLLRRRHVCHGSLPAIRQRQLRVQGRPSPRSRRRHKVNDRLADSMQDGQSRLRQTPQDHP